MVHRMAYFRIKMLKLASAYEHFIVAVLPRGGTIVVVDDQLRWPARRLGDRHFFQAGAVGGLEPAEYVRGSWIPTMVAEPPTLAIGLTKSYLHCGIRTPIKAFVAGLRDLIEARMSEIDVPTLVVRGERDRIVSAEWAATLTRLLPRGELATIGGFAHTLDYSAPGGLAAVTIPFFLRSSTPTSHQRSTI